MGGRGRGRLMRLPGVSWGMATHVGRVRRTNEDAAAVAWPVFVVADGMGGHAAGEVASRIAVTALAELGQDRDRTQVAPEVARAGGAVDRADAVHHPVAVRTLLQAVTDANRAILESAAAHPEQTGMGTTLVGVALTSAGGSPHWAVFSVGDSRVYRLIDDAISQVTVDHSEVSELVARGVIDAEAARTHPARNIITRSLGRDPMATVDTWVFPTYPGERFLLCSDGVSNELRDEQLRDLLLAPGGAQDAAEAVVAAAVAAGGRDNCTVIVIDHAVTDLPVDGGDEVEGDTAPREPAERPSDCPTH